MRPEVVIRIRVNGVRSIEILSETEREEKEGLKLYNRLKPGIGLLKQLASGGPATERRTGA